MASSATVAVPNSCSIIHTAIPLILSSTQTEWPKPFDEVWISKSHRAFFAGRSVCQIVAKPVNRNSPAPNTWFLGLCTENARGTAHRSSDPAVRYDDSVDRMPDLQTMGVTVRFFSILLDGAMQSANCLKLVRCCRNECIVLPCSI
jgi:hypothetical protein